jgi:hypothetical protein
VVIKRSLFSLPEYVDIAYKNQGNVALIPRGVITVSKGPGDTKIAQGIINDRSIPLFQSEGIRIRTDLTEYHKPRLPGRYKLTVQYRYENQADYQTATVVFWYIPKVYPLTFAVALLLAIYLAPRRRRSQIAIYITRAQSGIRKSPKRPQKVTGKEVKSIPTIEHQIPKKSAKKIISVASTDDNSASQKVVVKHRKK